jgi:hypothetical protein
MGRPRKPDSERARDIPPTGIRIPLELRAALEREAQINGRTLSGEILRRLKVSLEERHVTSVQSPSQPQGMGAEAARQRPVSDAHRMLLALFDAMGPDKQLALLTVLKR